MTEDSTFLHVVNAVNTEVDRPSTSSDITDTLAEPVSTGSGHSEVVDNLRGGRGHVAEHRRQDAMAKPKTSLDVWKLGFKAIVPVIPPGVGLTPRSQLTVDQLGKIPGLRASSGLWYGLPGWPALRAKRGDASLWSSWGANVGLLAAVYPGVDIDVSNENLANELVDFVRSKLGPAPLRGGRLPRLLAIYRSHEPVASWQINFRDPAGGGHLVELLGAGRQYLIAGTHPCGRLYSWTRDPNLRVPPDRVPAECLTVITPAQAARLRSEVCDFLLGLGFRLVTERAAARGGGQVDQESLKGTAAERELIAALMPRLPNKDDLFPDRASYIRLLAAVKAAFMDDPALGLEIAREWSDRWPGNARYPDGNEKFEAEWAGLNPPFRIGSSWLLNLLGEHGGFAAEVGRLRAQDFDDLPDETDATSPELPEWLR